MLPVTVSILWHFCPLCWVCVIFHFSSVFVPSLICVFTWCQDSYSYHCFLITRDDLWVWQTFDVITLVLHTAIWFQHTWNLLSNNTTKSLGIKLPSSCLNFCLLSRKWGTVLLLLRLLSRSGNIVLARGRNLKLSEIKINDILLGIAILTAWNDGRD